MHIRYCALRPKCAVRLSPSLCMYMHRRSHNSYESYAPLFAIDCLLNIRLDSKYIPPKRLYHHQQSGTGTCRFSYISYFLRYMSHLGDRIRTRISTVQYIASCGMFTGPGKARVHAARSNIPLPGTPNPYMVVHPFTFMALIFATI